MTPAERRRRGEDEPCRDQSGGATDQHRPGLPHTHPRRRLIGFPTESRPLHDLLWKRARARDFASRKIYDTRSALTRTAQGVTELASVNGKDFEGLGFRKVWNPLVKV